MIKKVNLTKVLTGIVFIGLVFVISLLYTTHPWTDRVWRGDSSMFIYFGKAMRAGKNIYTEIFDHKGPVIFVLNYLGTFLPGRVTGVYWIELSALAAGMWGLYRIARFYLGRYMSSILLIIYAIMISRYLQNGNLTEAYALPMWIYSLYLFVRYYRQEQELRFYEAIWVGISVMVTFLLRANLVLSWIPLVLILLIDYIQHQKWDSLRTTMAGFTIGFIGVGGMTSIWLMLAGVWDAFIFQAFTFNVTYLSHSSGDNAVHKFMLEMVKDYSVFIVLVFCLLVVSKRHSRHLTIGLLGAFLGTFYAATMSGRPYLHYLMLVFPIIMTMAILLVSHVSFNKKLFYYLFGIGLLLVYVPQMRLLKQQLVAENRQIIQWIKQKEIGENKQDQLAKEVSNYVHSITTPQDEIYSLFEAGRLYLLSDRLANTKFFSLPAVNFNEFPELMMEFYEEFDENPPKVIILKKGALAQPKLPFTSQMIQRIDNHYSLVFENAKYEVYQQIPNE